MTTKSFVSICLALGLAGATAADAAQFLWQTNSGGDDIHIVDVSTLKIVRRLVVGPQPHGIAAPDDVRVVYVSLEQVGRERGELVAIDPRTYAIVFRMPICQQPQEIDTTPDGRWVYVPCADGHYWVIDTLQRRVVRKISTGGLPHNTRASRDGRFMYLSPLREPKRVTIVDVRAGHQVIGEISFRDVVRPPALAADNTLFFQQVDGLNGFQVADITTQKVIATVEHSRPFRWLRPLARLPWLGIEVFHRCHGLEIRPDQKEIWSACGKRLNIHTLARPDFPEAASLPLIDEAYWLTFSPDSKYAFVAVARQNKVAVVDAQSRDVVSYIDVGTKPKRNLVISVQDRKD